MSTVSRALPCLLVAAVGCSGDQIATTPPPPTAAIGPTTAAAQTRSTAAPPAPRPRTSLCAPGTAVTDWWPGEYPGPVVQVRTTVTVPATPDTCAAEPQAPCTLSPGLIHPWAKGNSARFASIDTVDSYELLAPYSVEGDAGEVTLPKGSTVEERSYMAEGMCVLQAGGQRYTGECPGNGGNEDRFRKKTSPSPEYEAQQLMGVDCAEGHTGWVHVNDALFARDEVTHGVITGYGEIGPAGAGGL